MHKLPIFIFFFLVAASINLIKAQAYSDDVNVVTPDLKKLEWKTFEAVNQIRVKQDLPELVSDSVLYRAAIDHATYLLNEKKISHSQKTKERSTPQARVRLHGGVAYSRIGENIVEIPLGMEWSNKGRKQSTVTYQAGGALMADLWRNSPGHYKNIINQNYNCSALAVAYDNNSQRLIAVQVFGYIDTPLLQVDQPDYSKELLQADKNRLPYHLKNYRFNKKDQRPIRSFRKMADHYGYITGSFKTAKKVFKGRRSGIVQEFIPLDQFDSATRSFSQVPNRRNGLYELNGKLNAPVYRRQLLKYSRRHVERGKYKITVFKQTLNLPLKKPPQTFLFPLQLNYFQTEYNLFLIKRKRLVSFKTYSRVPNETFEVKFPELSYHTGFKPYLLADKERFYEKCDTLQFQFFYAKGEISISDKMRKLLEDTLRKVPGKIVKIEAEAFASVEGEQSVNIILAKKRLDEFIKLIFPFRASEDIESSVRHQEQWNLFSKQIKGTHLEFLKKKKVDEARLMVNKHLEDTLLLRFLNEQRYSKIKLIFKSEVQEVIQSKSLPALYDSLIFEFLKSPKAGSKLLKSLEQVQCALYENPSRERFASKLEPQILNLNKFPAFTYHRLIYDYSVLKIIDDKAFDDGMHQLANSQYFPARLKDQLLYNHLALIYNKSSRHELYQIKDVQKLWDIKYLNQEFYFRKYKKRQNPKAAETADPLIIIQTLPQLIEAGSGLGVISFPADSLWRYYYLNMITSLMRQLPHIPISKIYPFLPGFKQYFHPNNSILSDEERLKYALFYSGFKRYDVARTLIEPVALKENADKQALKMYLTLIRGDFEKDSDFVNVLIEAYPKLGQEEWCDLWFNPSYLNFLLLENIKLKKFYNSHCNR